VTDKAPLFKMMGVGFPVRYERHRMQQAKALEKNRFLVRKRVDTPWREDWRCWTWKLLVAMKA
jgi:hypothetical protein